MSVCFSDRKGKPDHQRDDNVDEDDDDDILPISAPDELYKFLRSIS